MRKVVAVLIAVGSTIVGLVVLLAALAGAMLMLENDPLYSDAYRDQEA